MTNNSDNYYTAYIVRESNSRRFLTRPTYSGRVKGVWNRRQNATLFFTREQAQSCASNINSRRPEGYSNYFAEVQPVIIRRRTSK